MVGKIIKVLLLLVVSAAIFSIASIAGVRNDIRKEKLLAEQKAAEAEAEAAKPKEVSSPYDSYTGGVLNLQMDYEVQLVGDDVLISVVSNLPDSYDLTAELSNVEEVKSRLGLENISSSALTSEQMAQINEETYSRKEKNFVTSGVCDFTFKTPPAGRLDLKITSPITKLQPSGIQDLLGDKGENLQGAYVVYLEEVADKSINFNASFVIEEDIKTDENSGGEAAPSE